MDQIFYIFGHYYHCYITIGISDFPWDLNLHVYQVDWKGLWEDVSILINFLIITVAGKKAKVIFSYDAKKEDELTLNVGDIVDILRVTEEDGWWSGQLGSKEGLFPSNYVEVIEYEDVAEANNSAVETKHSKLGW